MRLIRALFGSVTAAKIQRIRNQWQRGVIDKTDVLPGALLAGALPGASPGLCNDLLRRRRCVPDRSARGPERRTRCS